MIIDPNAAVAPPRFADETLRRVMEGQLALDIRKHLQSHLDRVQRELDHADKCCESWSDIPLYIDYDDIASDTPKSCAAWLSSWPPEELTKSDK
ncbi:hypothetical protein [Streptomyces abikoensis]|uniref:hypothetical protein n=1 Tax=Streptomyces abikoensis TaxID=97398 RepID=UPI0016746329|nr:hypothetical protein [Streptomyces abikoensis]